jgi:hypothetical protein
MLPVLINFIRIYSEKSLHNLPRNVKVRILFWKKQVKSTNIQHESFVGKVKIYWLQHDRVLTESEWRELPGSVIWLGAKPS